MSQKCVQKGCGKKFDDPDEPCIYHPGPPVFHEGQKGWACCKSRVLTFDEFLSIPPCTRGKHSTVDETPAPAPKPLLADDPPAPRPITRPTPSAMSSVPLNVAPIVPREPEPERNDPPDATVPVGVTCLRPACGKQYQGGERPEDEHCVYHPGQAIFHEGTKGWTCCKKRVLEFDEFLVLEGCTTTKRHLFLKEQKEGSGEEQVETVRNDFYQNSQTLTASFFLKGVLPKGKSSIIFEEQVMKVNLPTKDNKRWKADVELFAEVLSDKCEWKILGTKVEVTLHKKEVGMGWPVLKRDDGATGMILQVGRAGVAR